MRAGRLLSMLILLQLRGRLSAEALAREFEISVRTVYRDMDALSAAGAPVYAERGRNGGFALLDGYRTRLTGLSDEEGQALVLAGAGRAAADLGRGAALSSARLKLMAAMPTGAGLGADRTAQRFHLDPEPWYRSAATPESLSDLARAVWNERRVRIHYRRWEGEVERIVDPLGLVMKAGVWYLAAAVGTSVRGYRIDNVMALTVLHQPSRRPPDFDLSVWWTEWARDFESRLLSGRAEVRLSPAGLKRLGDVSQIAAEAARRDGSDDGDGWIRAVLPVEDQPTTLGWMLHLGAEVEVIGPPSLRAAVTSAIRAMAAIYPCDDGADAT